MNNKETLQTYNERLETNNISLTDILETINTLPDCDTSTNESKKLFLIKDGIEQIDVTGGHQYKPLSSDSPGQYAEIQREDCSSGG